MQEGGPPTVDVDGRSKMAAGPHAILRTTKLPVREMELARLADSDEPALRSCPPFRLDLAEERLWKGERELRLRRKEFALLRHLAQNPRRLITHSEIVEAVWGHLAMSESLLRTHLYQLRRVIGKEVIETVVGRGYRLVANARVLKQVADVLDALGTTSTAVLILGE